MERRGTVNAERVWGRCGLAATLVFLFLFAAACSSSDGGDSADAEQECTWNESEWDGCDWA